MGNVSFCSNVSIDDTFLSCQLEFLSTVDVWSANLFCSIEGFFLFLYCPLKFFSPPGIAGGSVSKNLFDTLADDQESSE